MKISLCLLFIFCSLVSLNAQSARTISYQAILRDNVDALIQNASNVSIRVSLLQGNIIDNNVVYEENHTTSTNANGLFTIEIGGGSVISGNYPTLQWGNGPYFLKTEIDPNGGTNYLITAISELLSVPLANYAFEAERLKGTAGKYAGWYKQTPESIASSGTFLETAEFVLTYINESKLFFHTYDSSTPTYFQWKAEVNPNNSNEIIVYYEQSLSFTATWTDGSFTILSGDGLTWVFEKE